MSEEPSVPRTLLDAVLHGRLANRATLGRTAAAFLLLHLFIPAAVAQEDCCNRIDDDGDGRIDFADADCAGAPECPIAFRRGDVNLDGRINLVDAIVLIRVVAGRVQNLHLCDEAKDVNDDGDLDVTDAIVLLQWLFRSGAAPPEPFSACGLDPTPDALLCLMLSEC